VALSGCGSTNPNGWGTLVWLNNNGTWASYGSGHPATGFTAVSNTKVSITGGTQIITVVRDEPRRPSQHRGGHLPGRWLLP